MTHRFGIDPARAATSYGQTETATDTLPPRILVVDDHALVRHGLALAIKLRFPDATVFEAGSLAEARRLVPSLGHLSAVLYDLQMGDANGLPGVEAMLRVLDGVPLVVISGTLDSGVIAACIRAGARGFLPKGGEAEVLDHALPIVLNGGLYAPLPPMAGAATAPPVAAGTPTPSAVAIEGLTERQREILMLLLEGRSNKEIARSLGILEGTIKVHLRSIMQRLGVRNRTQLALMAVKAGLTA
ncbi:LuxR C-terminal-related transcriptional regulator [Azospirillum sp. sgz301742]